MICLGVGKQLTELCDRSDQIGLHKMCVGEAPPKLPRFEAVTDGVGELASFFRGRAHRDGVTREESDVSLPAYGRVDLLCFDELGYMELDEREPNCCFKS